MSAIAVLSKTRTVTIFVDDVQTITVKQSIPKIEVFMGIEKITVKQQMPVILAYDDKIIEAPVVSTFVYGGSPGGEGSIADAQFYNTISWNTTWNGGYT